MDLRVGSKWILRKRLGAGSFGEIYSGQHILTKEDVAVKLEQARAHPPQLLNESRAYKLLAGGVGIPAVRWYGVEGDYNVMVMDLLGKSLQELFEQCGQKFTLKTVLMLADQMIARIEYLHNKNVLHRDIKPDNFMVGTGANAGLLYAIDLGLSRKYKDPKTGQHIPFREGKPLLGTARYTSMNTHLGIEQSRRDDLEGMAYVLVYFMKGGLPWMGLKAENKKKKYDLIAEKKLVTGIESLCQNLPSEFAIFLTEVRRLDFSDRPDYALYRQLFRDLFVREGFVFDYMYDWVQAKPILVPLPVVFSRTQQFDEHEVSAPPPPLLELGKRNHPSAPVQPTLASKLPVVKVAMGGLPPRPGRKVATPPWMVPPGIKPIPRAIRV
jgi:serine/threonine protein kinase